MARDEPPHQDLHCLQIYLFSSLALKELTNIYISYISESDGVVVDLREVGGNVISTEDCSRMWNTILPQNNICFGDREYGPCNVKIISFHNFEVLLS